MNEAAEGGNRALSQLVQHRLADGCGLIIHGRGSSGVSNVLVNPKLGLKPFPVKAIFLISKFKVKTIFCKLEGTARYPGLLRAPAEGFGRGFFCPLKRKKTF